MDDAIKKAKSKKKGRDFLKKHGPKKPKPAPKAPTGGGFSSY
jgi:hypothetical protein